MSKNSFFLNSLVIRDAIAPTMTSPQSNWLGRVMPPPNIWPLLTYRSLATWSNSCRAWCAVLSMWSLVFMWWCIDSVNRHSSLMFWNIVLLWAEEELFANAAACSSARADPGFEVRGGANGLQNLKIGEGVIACRIYPCPSNIRLS